VIALAELEKRLQIDAQNNARKNKAGKPFGRLASAK
jgi:hypothetical protein